MAEAGIITGEQQEVQVLSNTFNDSVPGGTFAIRGHVYFMYTTTPVADAMITNGAENPFVMTNENGYFEMLFSTTDSVLYCYKPDFTEPVFRGPFPDRHVLEVNFYLNNAHVMIITAKPVIYAYNAGQNVELSIKPRGHFTFTYPQTVDGVWNIQTNADGTITSLNDHKKYPYLFWEAENSAHKMQVENGTVSGYLVKTDTCVSFLENTLTAYGLNEKESADFITFWAPKMLHKPYALVQFLTNEAYASQVGELMVSPQPESLLRLYMYFVPLDSDKAPVELIKPAIEIFERKGFTVVEWGGSELNLTNLKPH
ncbi:MAG: hypothetical protein HYZ14_12645 [Bacteroidetes bacterium]|nr:hypothetical protein [Bacteroidota bacterium]